MKTIRKLTARWGIRWAAAALVGLTAVPAGAQAPAAPPAAAPAGATAKASAASYRLPEAYRVQPGDEVAVAVQPVPDLGSTAAVSPDGTLYLKEVGPVQAAGVTVAELQERIRLA